MSLYFIKGSKDEVSYFGAEIFLYGFMCSIGPFMFGTATGQTPVETYKYFKEMIREQKLEDEAKRKLIFAQLDTYIEQCSKDKKLPLHSYYMELANGLWKIPNRCAVIPYEFAEDPEAEAEKYEQTLKKLKKVSSAYFQLLGIGDTDGHIAFNMPGTAFESRVHVSDLNTQTIKANSEKFFDGDTTKVPRKAITTGIADILEADCIVLEAFGSKKADIVYKSFFEEPSEGIPASALQGYEGLLFVLLDDESATLIEEKHPERLFDIEFGENIFWIEIEKLLLEVFENDARKKYEAEGMTDK